MDQYTPSSDAHSDGISSPPSTSSSDSDHIEYDIDLPTEIIRRHKNAWVELGQPSRGNASNHSPGHYMTFLRSDDDDDDDDDTSHHNSPVRTNDESNTTSPYHTWNILCLRIRADVTRFQDSPEGTAAGLGWRVLKDVTIPPMISITVAGAVFELMQIIAGGLGINTQMRIANTLARYPTWVIAIVTQVIAHLHRNRYRPDIIKPLYDKAINPLYQLLMPIIDTLGITAFLNQLSMATIAWFMRITTGRPRGSEIFIPNAAAYSSIAFDFVLAGAAARLNYVQETLEISGDLDTPIAYPLVRSEGFLVESPRAQAISRLNRFDRFLLHKVSRMGFYGITAMATFHEAAFDAEVWAGLDPEAPGPFWSRMIMTFLPAMVAGYLQYTDEPSDSRFMIGFNGVQTFMTIALILITFFGYIYGAPPETQVYSGIVEVLSYLWPTLLALSTGSALINVAHDWPEITHQQPLVDEAEPIGLDRRLGSRRHFISSSPSLFSHSGPLTSSTHPIASINGPDGVSLHNGHNQPSGQHGYFGDSSSDSDNPSDEDMALILNPVAPVVPTANASTVSPSSSSSSPISNNAASQPSSSSSAIMISAARYGSTPSTLSREEGDEGSLPKADPRRFFSMRPNTSQE